MLHKIKVIELINGYFDKDVSGVIYEYLFNKNIKSEEEKTFAILLNFFDKDISMIIIEYTFYNSIENENTIEMFKSLLFDNPEQYCKKTIHNIYYYELNFLDMKIIFSFNDPANSETKYLYFEQTYKHYIETGGQWNTSLDLEQMNLIKRIESNLNLFQRNIKIMSNHDKIKNELIQFLERITTGLQRDIKFDKKYKTGSMISSRKKELKYLCQSLNNLKLRN